MEIKLFVFYQITSVDSKGVTKAIERLGFQRAEAAVKKLPTAGQGGRQLTA
jgi:hypothetical protein